MKKKIIFGTFIVVTLSFVSFKSMTPFFHGELRIGKLNKGVPIIVLDQNVLKNDWENTLSDWNPDLNFSSFQIKKNKENSETADYLILANDTAQNLTSVVGLKLDEDYLYEANWGTPSAVQSRIVVCDGCVVGCNPSLKPDGTGVCLNPCGGGKCKKTETLKVDYIW